MTVLLCSIFFASGVSALIFETLWFRQAGLAFGNSVWASSLILSGFMGGLALGSALAIRYGKRLRNPTRAYAIAEVSIALTGIGLVYLFPALGVMLAPWLYPLLEHIWILNLVRLLMAFLLLLIPSTAMGMTLPLLTKTLTGSDSNFGLVLGQLYGWNTLGAVTGVVIGEMYLIRFFGIHGTALIAGFLNTVAAAVAGWFSIRTSHQSLASASADQQAPHWIAERHWLVAAFFSGFCLLALEVIWFRFLVLFVIGYSMAFALMLGIVLAGIGLGGLVASRWLRFSADAYRFGALIVFLAGLICVVSYTAFPLVIKPFESSPYTISEPLEILQVGMPLMFPVSFFSGVFFTLVGTALRDKLPSEIETAGVLTLANTMGAVLGSLVGGFILLPVLGMERSFFLIAILYGGIGTLLLLRGPGPHGILYVIAAVFLLSITLFPFGTMEKRLIQFPVNRYVRKLEVGIAAKVAAVREGLTETIIYLEMLVLGRPAFYVMLTNAHSMSSTPFVSRRYMKLYVYWPMAVHPNLKHALLIAYGIGNTAKALTDSKSLETIDVVDISRDILEMNNIVYPDKADQPLSDPRVRIHIEDGRNFLQMSDQRFDLITAEPPPPRNTGVVNLYTREYFQLLYDRLAEGGIVTYWLPLHLLTDLSTKAILHAFCDVFEDCSLWNGSGTQLMMVGIRNAQGPVSEKQFIRQWNEPIVATEMKRLGFERPEQLGALFIGDAEYLRGLLATSPILVDNYPKLIEAHVESQEGADRFFQSLTDVSAARERFRRSPIIKRLWPERLLTESLSYFDFQDMINAQLYGNLIRRPISMEDVHRLLTRSSLSAPVLWRWGSDSDVQRIVANAQPEELTQPTMQFHLGVRLISERNYAAAVQPLSRAEQLTELRQNAFQLRIFALCMSGQAVQAQRLMEEQAAQIIREKGLADAESLDKASLISFCR